MRKLFLAFIFLSFGTILFAQKAVNVSLIMPFCSKQISEDPNHTYASLGNMCREYYQGMLIALDSIDRAGGKVNFNVFDTQNDSLVMVKLMQKNTFKESDLIIGPVLQSGNKMLSDFAKQKKVYHVSPLMTFSKTTLNDAYWVSSNPNLPAFAGIIYKYITKQFNDSANIIIVSDKSSPDKSISPAFKKIVPVSKNVKIKVVDYTPTLDLNALLSATLPNQIVIPSNKEQSVNAILYKLKDSNQVYKLNCYGLQQWFDFKNADISLWQQKKVRFATTYFVDYTDTTTKQFVAAYRERFATEPSESAIKGYDQGLLLMSALIKEGKDFVPDELEDKDFKALHTIYRLQKQKEGGYYQNNYLNILQFEHDVLKKLN